MAPSSTQRARCWASSRPPWRVRPERRANSVFPRVQTPPTTPTVRTSPPWRCPSPACGARFSIFPAGPRTRRTRASSTSPRRLSAVQKLVQKRRRRRGSNRVLIETDDGASWASGVIIRAGRPGGAEGPARSALALTNAHVVRPSAAPPAATARRPRARRPRANRHRKMDRRRAHSYLRGTPRRRRLSLRGGVGGRRVRLRRRQPRRGRRSG